MDIKADSWNDRYIADDIPWDIGEASPALIQYVEKKIGKDQKILIPGAGNGYEAEWLHQNGWTEVSVCDWSAKALSNIQERVVDFPGNHLIQSDFFALDDTYDLILEQTFFCAIPISMRTDYVHKSHSLLKRNGRISGVLFGVEFEKQGPPFGGNKEEYIGLFKSHFDIKILETCYNSIPPRDGSELFFEFLKF